MAAGAVDSGAGAPWGRAASWCGRRLQLAAGSATARAHRAHGRGSEPLRTRRPVAAAAAVLFSSLLRPARCQPDPSSSVSGAQHPTLDEVRRRAAPWSSHLAVEPAFSGGIAAFLLRGLLAQEEVEELIAVAQAGMKSRQEVRSKFHATVSLDKAPELNSSAVVQRLNARLAAMSGLPESNIEEGYFSVYNEGHELQALHLDNHHAVLSPRRLVSFVIYLLGEDQGLTGGGTVFPLAPPEASDNWQLEESHIGEWNEALGSSAGFRLGEDPQRARICPMAPGSQAATDFCTPALELARHICQTALDDEHDLRNGLVHAKPGDAIMFYQLDADGRETARAAHASCPVDVGNKVVLAKFVRGGPKPFSDEAAFMEARRQWHDTCERRIERDGEL